MRIEIVPIIIGDDGQEIRKNDTVIMRTKYMDEESVAIINNIDTTMVTATFFDILYGGKARRYRINEIRSMRKKQ